MGGVVSHVVGAVGMCWSTKVPLTCQFESFNLPMPSHNPCDDLKDYGT